MNALTLKKGHSNSQGLKDCSQDEGHISPSAIKSRVSSIRSTSEPSLLNIPPPPWHGQASRPSVSMMKRLWKPAEDPFLAAFKECTKNGSRGKQFDSRKETKVMSLVKRSRLVFSCKDGCQIKEDSLVKLPHLPPIPRERLTHKFKDSKVPQP